MTSDTQEIMRHRIESGVDDFIIHREHENRMEMTLERTLEGVTGFAIDMPGLALRGRMALGFQRGHPEDRDALRRERRNRVGDEAVLVLGADMLQHIERVGRIEGAWNRPVEHIV